MAAALELVAQPARINPNAASITDIPKTENLFLFIYNSFGDVF
jgi:hypothetical protein